MENWGAIFYFEPELLFDPARTTESGRQRIHTVVAHEMAHQWFGDLVTMAWWDDLWLNEGFASWMEGKATNDLNPSWKAADAAIAFERESAMAIDATQATHPIIRHVETVDQISDAFDGITYAKGQAVIGMLESWLGEKPFRDGIRRYMAKYKYGNTVTDQLWGELSAATGKNVAEVARDYTLQGGVPLVTMTGARCTGGNTVVTLTQSRFGLDEASRTPQTWHVPIKLATLGGATTDAIVTGASPSSVTVKGCGTLVLNQGKGSYTRVQYDDAAHAAIVRDYTRLALGDRLGTLGDDYALAAGGYQDLSRYFAVQDRVGVTADPLEWSLVATKLGALTGLYQNTPLEAKLQAKQAALFAPVLARIGFEAKPGESALVSNLRETLIGRLGYLGDAQVAARARQYVGQLAANPTAIPAGDPQPHPVDLRHQCDAGRMGPAVRADPGGAFAGRQEPLRVAARCGARRGAGEARAGTAEGQGADRPAKGQPVARDRRIASRSGVRLGGGEPRPGQRLCRAELAGALHPVAGGGSNDPAMPGKIKAYASQFLPESARNVAEQTVSLIAVRKAVADRLRPATERWLAR